jgi:hypothetical protein
MKFSWVALLTLIAGGGLTALGTALGQILPKYATIIMGVVGIIGIVAGIILQASQPAAKIVADAPVVNSAGAQVATNISSTSTLLPKAP